MSIHFLKRKFIPTHNADMDAIEELNTVSFEIAGPYALELLEWIQDLNWPVAQPIIAYFQPHIQEIKEELLTILNSKEEEWKRIVLEQLFGNINLEDLPSTIQKKLQNFAYTPSPQEAADQLDLLAQAKVENADPTNFNAFRFELSFSPNQKGEEIWEDLQKSFPKLEQLSPQIGQIHLDAEFQELSDCKIQLLSKLFEIKEITASPLERFLSRYHIY